MRGKFAAGLAWTAVGLYVAVAAHDLGIGSVGEPGPGLLAFLLGIAMAILGGVGAVRSAISLVGARGISAGGARWPWRMTGLAIALLLYIAALIPIGFPLATFAFLVALFLAFAELSWLRAATLSAMLSGAAYALFKLALGIQLPAGLLG